MQRTEYDNLAGTLAILASLSGFLYAISFIIISRTAPALGVLLSGLFLALTGLFTSGALIGLYGRLREGSGGFGLWGLLLALAGSFGSLIHGGYDLANAIHVPDSLPANIANLPNPVDPRGLLTFGTASLGLFLLTWLMGRSGDRWPASVIYLGYALAALSALLYLGRLIVLDASSLLIVVPALLAGFIVSPGFYLMLGLALRSGAVRRA
jgi:hypothetical protein